MAQSDCFIIFGHILIKQAYNLSWFLSMHALYTMKQIEDIEIIVFKLEIKYKSLYT
jgi:hypothetical protein